VKIDVNDYFWGWRYKQDFSEIYTLETLSGLSLKNNIKSQIKNKAKGWGCSSR
jgi:hypothetical protein